MDGRIQCVTCHDAHQSATPDPASKHTSLEIGVAANETGNGLGAGGSAQLTLVAAGTTPRAFRVRVESVNGSGGTYVISHNFGLAAPTFTAAQAFTNNTTFALDDPATTVRISAGASVGDYWDFYISFPFLRLSNVADAICVVCHLERAMNDVRARGTDVNYPPNGARTFSHPVGVGLNANGKGNDAVAVLDANGALQSVGDGNTTNDLVLPSSVVRCTTCHAVHNADSNSLTKDAR